MTVLSLIKDELRLVSVPFYYLSPNETHHCRLDTIGLAGFSHDFGALEGKHAPVTEIFDSFTSSSGSSALSIGLGLLAQVFPFLIRIPTPRSKLIGKLNTAMEEISNTLLARTKQELDMGVVDGKEEKSVIGLLSTSSFSETRFMSLTYSKQSRERAPSQSSICQRKKSSRR